VRLPAALPAAIGQRAGGGHGFSGGGGGGGSGGGGGGTHVFVGGGGGGAAAGGALLFILLFGGVAALILVVFLITRFGRGRPAAEGFTPPAYPHSDQPAYAPGSLPWDQPQGAATTASADDDGLAAIRAHDPDFNPETFKSDVERSFFVVQEAWSDLKPDLSRRVMADGIWQQHRTQIEGYQSKGIRNMMDGLAIGRVDLLRASSDDQSDTLVTRVTATCADYDVEIASGKVVRGNKHDMEPWQEDWVFQRSSKATTKPGGGTMQQKCPNCGAPLDLDLAGVCKYCRAPVMSGQYDWVLTRIDQV